MVKQLPILLLAASSAIGLFAQDAPPPPPPDAAPSSANTSTVSGRISQLNYDHEGRLDGFVLSNNTLVQLPRDWAFQLESAARPGEQVKATGWVRPTQSGMQVVDPQMLSVGSRNLSMKQPSRPAPFTGNGVIKQLNYGRQGEVNGFVLQNGTFVKTPAFDGNSPTVIKAGSNIGFSGMAHTSPEGKTVVDAQSITVNGQTIALNTAPPPPPRGPLGPKGRRGTPPPPPDVPAAAPPQPAAPAPPPPAQ
jgi:hypothetical protein